MAHVQGSAPPVISTASLYGASITPSGRFVVVMASGASTSIASSPVASTPEASVRVIVKAGDSTAVGVPVIAPVAALRVRPPGRSPEETDQRRGAVPPVAEIV